MILHRVNIALGILIAFAISFITLYAFLPPGVFPIWFSAKHIETAEWWLNRYQTLVAAFFAIIAAYSAWYVSKQNIARLDLSLGIAQRQTSITAVSHITDRMETVSRVYETVNQNFDAMFAVDYSMLWTAVDQPLLDNKANSVDRVWIEQQIAFAQERISFEIKGSVAQLTDAYKRLQKIINDDAITMKCRDACSRVVSDSIKICSMGDFLIDVSRALREDLLGDQQIEERKSVILDQRSEFLAIRNSLSHDICARILGEEERNLFVLLDQTLNSIELIPAKSESNRKFRSKSL